MNLDTIVLIHGFWVTPRSWEHWKAHYEQQGYRMLTPAYPGFEVEVEALNADPTPIENLSVPAVIDHLTDVIGGPADRLGLADAAVARSEDNTVEIYEQGRRAASFPLAGKGAEAATRYPFALGLLQHETEQLRVEHLARLGRTVA
jgi:hypothetical protein